MRNVIFMARFYAIAMRINVTANMTTCRDTHFAAASEKARSVEMPFSESRITVR